MEKFECDVCHETFLKSGLQRHYRRAHKYENATKCCQCEKVFKNADDLNVHVTNVHNDGEHECNNCDCPFVKRRNLKSLEKIEESSRVGSTIPKLKDQSTNAKELKKHKTHFDCDLCDDRFLKTNLQWHFQKKHNYKRAFYVRNVPRYSNLARISLHITLIFIN